jgi:hypothetical protein
MGEDLERFCVWRLPSGVRRNKREIRERSSTDTWRETGEVVPIVVSVRTIRQLGEVVAGFDVLLFEGWVFKVTLYRVRRRQR